MARLLGLKVRIRRGRGCVPCECCVLSGQGLCDGLITRPEQSYQVWSAWVWSWSLDIDEAIAHWGLLRQGGKKSSRDVAWDPDSRPSWSSTAAVSIFYETWWSSGSTRSFAKGNVGHRGPVYKGLGAMNPCDLSKGTSTDKYCLCI
jgi:hypothetical protein